MTNHRNPQLSVSKQAPSDNFNPGHADALITVALEPYQAAGGAS